ncbi:MAG: sensor histidine kinase, partial [Veillonella sp.]|nr:sensor histidine kinase [Veillonella sp.]
MDIGQDILNRTPLGPLQISLLEHISKLISFGESLTRQRIQIFTPLLETGKSESPQQCADML